MEKIESVIHWDKYFINLCYEIAKKSKDPSTKVGSLIITQDNEIIATGFNGFPRKVGDYKERYENREIKYLFIEHGERNAIYSAAKKGISTNNCKMYVPGMPCNDCCRAIIQCGITEVIMDAEYDAKHPGYKDRWAKSSEISSIMFQESGIILRSI